MDLTDLLSTCVDACERGCAEIRRVAAQLDRNNEGGVRQVDYKIAGDPRSALTAADLAAQLAVVEPLATAWPGLRIVGEEDLACDVGIELVALAVPAGCLKYSSGVRCSALVVF